MFTKIDIKSWDRAEYYNHFINHVPCVFNITANIDITKLLKFIKPIQVKLYPSLIFMLSKFVNENQEFRLSFDDENNLGVYDECHPSFTIPNGIPDGFSGIWAYFNNNFALFYENYLSDVKEHSHAITYAPKSNQPNNTFYISCTPEISFTSLSLTLFNNAKYLTPMFTIGKFFKQNGKILLPLSACLHHAACDGAHAAKLYKHMQLLASNPSEWLNFTSLKGSKDE